MRRMIASICVLMLCAGVASAWPVLHFRSVQGGAVVYNLLIAADTSGNGNDGTCSTNTILTQDGSEWYADMQATAESINLGDVLDIGTSDFIFSTWIYTSLNLGNQQYIINKQQFAAAGYYLRYNTFNDRIEINIGGLVLMTADDSLEHDSQWHHVAVNGDRSGNCTIWIDGVESASTDMTSVSGSIANAFNLYFGFRESSADYFKEYIDGVGIWFRESTNDVVSLNAAGRDAAFDAISTTAQQGFWPMIPAEE